MKDYFSELGLKMSATTLEIRQAHRKLSKEYHPDLNRNKLAEEKFKRIQEAYEKLIDEDARNLYLIQYKLWERVKNEEFKNYKTPPQQNPASKPETSTKKAYTNYNSYSVDNELYHSRKSFHGFLRVYFVIAYLSTVLATSLMMHKVDQIFYFYIVPTIFAGLIVYFIPSIIAIYNDNDSLQSIFIINIFCFIPALGFFGWVYILFTSFAGSNSNKGLLELLFRAIFLLNYKKYNIK